MKGKKKEDLCVNYMQPLLLPSEQIPVPKTVQEMFQLISHSSTILAASSRVPYAGTRLGMDPARWGLSYFMPAPAVFNEDCKCYRNQLIYYGLRIYHDNWTGPKSHRWRNLIYKVLCPHADLVFRGPFGEVYALIRMRLQVRTRAPQNAADVDMYVRRHRQRMVDLLDRQYGNYADWEKREICQVDRLPVYHDASARGEFSIQYNL